MIFFNYLLIHTTTFIMQKRSPGTQGIFLGMSYDKRDDFNFEIVNSPFLDGHVPRSPSYGVYISQLIRFA